MTLQSICQKISENDSGSTRLPNRQLRAAIIEVETGRAAKKELDVTKHLLWLEQQRVLNRDSIIAEFKSKELTWVDLRNNYEERISIHERQRQLDQGWITNLNRSNKKLKRGKVFILIGAALVEAGTIYLLAR